MRKLIIMVIATALSVSSYAQSDVDALRYSMLDFGGTARSLGSGNAYGALGGDMSVTSMNPAGLAIYRSSELTITPGLLSINSDATYYGQSTTDDRYHFQLNNVGLVFANVNDGKANATDGWVGGAFALTYNKVANYNNAVTYSGFNDGSSLLNTYADFLNSGGGTNPGDVFDKDPFGAGLAWETYLLNPLGTDSTQYYPLITDGNVQQTKVMQTDGGMGEFDISFAGNYGNRLYIGATIGIPHIRYVQSYTWKEEDINNEYNDFNSYSLVDVTETYGTGINAKFGLIYRLNDYLRLGGAVHTPTLFGMSDNYYSSMSSDLNSGDYSYDSPIGEYNYELVTPWRVIGSAAVTLKNIGFISAEYEFVDYSESFFNFNRTLDAGDLRYETTVNTNIDTKYGASSNIRLGAELMYDVFRFRAGYIMSSTPFNDGIAAEGADLAKNTYTAGIGIKDKSYFIDLAFAHSNIKQYDIQYVYDNGSGVNDGAVINTSINNFLLSFGFRF